MFAKGGDENSGTVRRPEAGLGEKVKRRNYALWQIDLPTLILFGPGRLRAMATDLMLFRPGFHPSANPHVPTYIILQRHRHARVGRVVPCGMLRWARLEAHRNHLRLHAWSNPLHWAFEIRRSTATLGGEAGVWGPTRVGKFTGLDGAARSGGMDSKH